MRRISIGRLLMALALATLQGRAAAQEAVPPPSPELLPPPPPVAHVARLHPAVVVRDSQGRPVIESRQPTSPLKTCGGCHDADWISRHSHHADLGAEERTALGEAPSGRPWDFGPGLMGRWDPLDYSSRPRLGSPSERALWLRQNGWRVVGAGGPHAAELGEMNCFLCHVEHASNPERVRELERGRTEWAATASLSTLGLFQRVGEGWAPVSEAFTPEGAPKTSSWRVVPPAATQCGLCHGVVYEGSGPLTLRERTARDRMTETEGTVFSGQRISQSAINLVGKQDLSRPWDVHAERMVGCGTCHFAPNDPVQSLPGRDKAPAHLRYDARHAAIAEYLARPDHRFAAGARSARERQAGSPRGCEDCHEPAKAHGWLPRIERHLMRLACESCHIPRVHAPARAETDWSVLVSPGTPRVTYRGTQGGVTDPGALVDGYRPALLPRRSSEGPSKLAPFNLVVTWFWVWRDAGVKQPVPLERLGRAFFQDGRHHPDLLRALDRDRNGRLEPAELVLDTSDRVRAVRERLAEAGVAGAELVGEMAAYPLHHGVAPGRFATRRCEDCHDRASRLAEAFPLVGRAPFGTLPVLVGDAEALLSGDWARTPDGGIELVPSPARAGLYLLGHSRFGHADGLGLFALLGALLAAGVHGGLRWQLGRRRVKDFPGKGAT